jgi:hypothetical protein
MSVMREPWFCCNSRFENLLLRIFCSLVNDFEVGLEGSNWHHQTPSSVHVQRQNLRVRTCREADHLMLIAIAGGQFPSTDIVSALLVEFQLINATGGRLLSILVFPKLHIFYTLPMFYNTPGSSTIFPSKLV